MRLICEARTTAIIVSISSIGTFPFEPRARIYRGSIVCTYRHRTRIHRSKRSRFDGEIPRFDRFLFALFTPQRLFPPSYARREHINIYNARYTRLLEDKNKVQAKCAERYQASLIGLKSFFFSSNFRADYVATPLRVSPRSYFV